MSTICNPIAGAEVVGREIIEAQIPSRDSYKINNIIDNIRRINENVGDTDLALGEVKKLQGEWTGSDDGFVSFTKNLFGNDSDFTNTILELENSAIALKNITTNIEGLVDTSKTLTFSEVSTALMRGYLRNVEILLPEGVKNSINENIKEFPLFVELSESLGSMYYNMALSDNTINMVDSIIGDTLESTGLSNILSQHQWVRMLPEYAVNFHNNVRLFQRLGSRVLPKCTYSKVFHIMDEPLAHMYDLASDVLGFLDVLDNRKKYLKLLIGEYGALLKKINNVYPICHEYSIENTPFLANINNEGVLVDNMGRKINKTDNFKSVVSVDQLT